MSTQFAVILEDHTGRAAAMRLTLARALPQASAVIFATERETTRFFDRYLGNTILISLDHDLLWPLLAVGGASAFGDPGTGRGVANYLAGFPCVCPVLVHSSNTDAVPGMLRVLREARWVCSCVRPEDAETWIPTTWRMEIEMYRARGLIF